MKPKLLYLITEDWFFCSHFIERAVAAREAGYEVVVVTRERDHGDRIRAAGLRLVPLEFARRSVNPLRELGLLFEIWCIYRREQPQIVHQIAVKPILYGSLVARVTGVPLIINAPVGMGYAFSSTDRKARVLRPMIQFAYRMLMNPFGSRVIFENQDDLDSFVDSGFVRRSDSVKIRGAGIDLVRFAPKTAPLGTPLVVLTARMLRDKGIAEFVGAAQQLHEQGVSGRFVLVGDPDPGNLASISLSTLHAWNGCKGVEWWGWREDVAEVLSQASIVCLPSYREGLPKSLLEAAACGIPIVATNTTGCRDVVVDGENGILVPVRNVDALAAALKKLLQDANLRQLMGARGRLLAENEFSSERVIRETLAVYSQLNASTQAFSGAKNACQKDS